jgi:hypothetical protein
MQARRFISILVIVLVCLPLLAQEQRAGFHDTTDWDLRPSFLFDTLCALNFLSGDKYYLEFYQNDYDRLSPQLRPQERAAFVNLKRRIKDENGGIISAQLALYFSTTDAESLDDMIRVVKDSSTMQRNLKASPYYSDAGWKVYEESRGDLETAFKALSASISTRTGKQRSSPRLKSHARPLLKTCPGTTSFPGSNRRWVRRARPIK